MAINYGCLCITPVLAVLMYVLYPVRKPLSKGNVSSQRGDNDNAPADAVHTEETWADILNILNASEQRRPKLVAVLRPMFTSLPHVEGHPGQLAHGVARYALHRALVQLHGWDVRGLRPAASSEESPVAEYIKRVIDVMEAADRGLTLEETASLAAIIEELTHLESVDKLQDVLSAMEEELQNDSSLTRLSDEPNEHISKAIALTMSHTHDKEVIEQLTVRALTDDGSIDWEDLKFYHWLADTQHTVAQSLASRSNPFVPFRYGFDFGIDVLEELGDHYGRWQDLECRSLKTFLVSLDKQSLGRVPLPEFYGAQIDGAVPPPFQFAETEQYLRHLGALDETVIGRPGLLVPNYVNAYSNCILSTEIYSVCCIDECEGLLAKIEIEIAAESAFPADIARVVENLPSDTVEAPRNLSISLMSRLVSMADVSGRVALHSRLFAQWLHYAYPYECAFPHVQQVDDTPVVEPTLDAYMQEDRRVGGVMELRSDRIEEAYAKAHERHSLSEGEADGHTAKDLMWTEHDVLLFEGLLPTTTLPPQLQESSLRYYMLPAMCVAACVSALWTLRSSAKTLSRARAPHAHDKDNFGVSII